MPCRKGGRGEDKLGEFPREMCPEYLMPELAQLLDRYSDAAYLAIGAQSGSEQMLEAMHREHDVAAVERAVSPWQKTAGNSKKSMSISLQGCQEKRLKMKRSASN